jgi:ubiquitin-activating enzyme E1
VTLHDTKTTTWNDLSSQFYLRQADIGKNRAEQSLEQLSELNAYTQVKTSTGELNEALLKGYTVVILADGIESEEKLLKLSGFCRQENICFILAETRGVFSRLFCDFGDEFTVVDVNGEQPISVMIAGITQDVNGLVTCLDESRHGLEDGDCVTFSEVQGMSEVNGKEFEIKVMGPYTFTIGDTNGKS